MFLKPYSKTSIGRSKEDGEKSFTSPFTRYLMRLSVVLEPTRNMKNGRADAIGKTQSVLGTGSTAGQQQTEGRGSGSSCPCDMMHVLIRTVKPRKDVHHVAS